MNRIAAYSQGRLRGESGRNQNITVFRGVPYAAPPVGSLRWRAPQPAAPWDGIRDAALFSAIPVQTRGYFMNVTPFEDNYMSEDCLYLNVWTPSVDSEAKLPVFIWYYGGAFQGGYGSAAMFDGEAFAEQGIVVVTVNYRVGLMGFLAHPDMEKEATGNFGLLDQIAALHWVHEHIAAFGGDPEHITIGGQSAGSMSVNNLMCSPMSSRLICGAICQSGDAFMRLQRSLEEAIQDGAAMAEKMNAGSLDELRALPASAFVRPEYDAMRALCGSVCTPIVDGKVLVEPQSVTICSGGAAQVPMLIGTNNDEGQAPYGSLLDWYGDNHRDAVAELFPESEETDAVFGRMAMQARYEAWADLREKYGQPTWIYLFAQKVLMNGRIMGAVHSAELTNVFHSCGLTFGNPNWGDGSIQVAYTPENRALEDTMNAFWAQFIKTGNPNREDLPRWPAHSENAYLRLDKSVLTQYYTSDTRLQQLCEISRQVLQRRWSVE